MSPGTSKLINTLQRLTSNLEHNLDRHRITLNTLEVIIKEVSTDCPCIPQRSLDAQGHDVVKHADLCPVSRGLLSIKLCRDSDRR